MTLGSVSRKLKETIFNDGAIWRVIRETMRMFSTPAEFEYIVKYLRKKCENRKNSRG